MFIRPVFLPMPINSSVATRVRPDKMMERGNWPRVQVLKGICFEIKTVMDLFFAYYEIKRWCIQRGYEHFLFFFFCFRLLVLKHSPRGAKYLNPATNSCNSIMI